MTEDTRPLSPKERAKLIKLVEEQKKRDVKKKHKASFRAFTEERLKLKSKTPGKGYIDFIPTEGQNILFDEVERQISEEGKIKVICLKGRQSGVSTAVSALTFHHMTTIPHAKVGIVGQKKKTNEAIMGMSRNYYEYLPDDEKPAIKRETLDVMEVVVPDNDGNETTSSLNVYSAGSEDAGRGETFTFIHCSEVAFWQYDEEILQGLMQGVPDEEGTGIILESTANGATGIFYELWQGANKTGKDWNGLHPVFIPWFTSPEYQKPLDKHFIPTDEDREFQEKYGISDEQLYWRQQRINVLSPEGFAQEYPSFAEEAFLASGSPAFSSEVINNLPQLPSTDGKNWCKSLKIFERAMGEAEMESYEVRGWDDKFVIGADVAEGTGKDYSTAVIMNQNGRVIASYASNTIYAQDFGILLNNLGTSFGSAFLVVESNNFGNTTLSRLEDLQYPNLYIRDKGEAKARYGFNTNEKTKPELIELLREELASGAIQPNGGRIIDELLIYQQNANKKFSAPAGKHDDFVIALALAAHGLKYHRYEVVKQREWEKNIKEWKEYRRDNPDQWL